MAHKKAKKVSKKATESKAKKITRKPKLETVQAFNSNIDEVYKKDIAPDQKEVSMAPEVLNQRKIDERKNIRAPQRNAR